MSKVRLSIWSQAQRPAVTVACLEVRPGTGSRSISEDNPV